MESSAVKFLFSSRLIEESTIDPIENERMEGLLQ